MGGRLREAQQLGGLGMIYMYCLSASIIFSCVGLRTPLLSDQCACVVQFCNCVNNARFILYSAYATIMLSKRHSITRSLYYDKVSHFPIYVPLHQQYHTINWLTTIFSLTSVSANFSTSNKLFLSTFLIKTRGSAIAEEPRDALRQLKYYGRLLTELLTRSSANPEEPCEHTVS